MSDRSTSRPSQDAASRLVRKLWQYCSVLRDDGLSYPDYVEQLTYLLFLKMASEQGESPVPTEYSWQSFATKDAAGMHRHYSRALRALGSQPGMLGVIFGDAKNKIRDPAKLRLLVVDLIGQTEWTGVSADIKGDAYEGLLEKNARDTKSGAGQYFTPRPLIDAIVECINPRAGEVICDPACGTGGFLLAAHSHLRTCNPKLNETRERHLVHRAIRGVELVPEVARLAAMNLLLHGIGGTSAEDIPIKCADSLKSTPMSKVDVVLTNPPFGVKGSVTFTREERGQRSSEDLTVVRPDFVVQTANKQLNFLQHVCSLLRPGGRAAVVVPDNVLFEAGAASTIRRQLLEEFTVHTLLRLPAGIFYAQGVQANVLFFDRPATATQAARNTAAIPPKGVRRSTSNTSPRPAARHKLWVYDLRSGNRFSLKTRPLAAVDLEEFVALYRSGAQSVPQLAARREQEPRWRSFDVLEILDTADCNLDLVRDDPAVPAAMGGIAKLDEIARAIAGDLDRAMVHLALASRKLADDDC